MAALDTELAWLADRQAEPRPLTEVEFDRIQALQREAFDLGRVADWYKTVVGCFGPISVEYETSRRSIGRDRAAEERRGVRR